MPHGVFISHSSHDKAVAVEVCTELERRGIRCWIAPRDIPLGAEYGGRIAEAIACCRVFVLVFSRDANDSRDVSREVTIAMSKGKTILPIRIDDTLPSGNMEYALSNVQWLDALAPPMTAHLTRLGEAVAALLRGNLSGNDPVTDRGTDPGSEPDGLAAARGRLGPRPAGPSGVLRAAEQIAEVSSVERAGDGAAAPSKTPPRVRYDNWEDYAQNQIRNNTSVAVLEQQRGLHSWMLETFGVAGLRIHYTPGQITYSPLVNGRRGKVILYSTPRRRRLELFLPLEGLALDYGAVADDGVHLSRLRDTLRESYRALQR